MLGRGTPVEKEDECYDEGVLHGATLVGIVCRGDGLAAYGNGMLVE